MESQAFIPVEVAMKKKSEEVNRFWFLLAKFGLFHVSYKFTAITLYILLLIIDRIFDLNLEL